MSDYEEDFVFLDEEDVRRMDKFKPDWRKVFGFERNYKTMRNRVKILRDILEGAGNDEWKVEQCRAFCKEALSDQVMLEEKDNQTIEDFLDNG